MTAANQAAERRRVTCPVCLTDRPLTSRGRVWTHSTWQLFAWGASWDVCPGTGLDAEQSR